MNRIFLLTVICWAFLISCSTTKKTSNYHDELTTYREQYKNGFLQDPRSPLTKEDLPFLSFYEADLNLKLNCNCTKATDAKPFEMPTYSGVTRTYILHSIATCPYQGQRLTLELYKNIHLPINPLYKNNLFLPFKDETSGDSTYGGGRYINLMVTDIVDDKIIIDFNKAYNPWCAFSDGFNCPIPPKANHLPVSIKAGEKMFTGTYKEKKS